jgi:hypothetical protein
MSFGQSVILTLLFAGVSAASVVIGAKLKNRIFFFIAALAVVISLGMLGYGLLTLLLVNGIK